MATTYGNVPPLLSAGLSSPYKLEHVFAAAPRIKQGDLGAGWADITNTQLGSGPFITTLEFETGEYYYEAFHLAHGTDLTLSQCDIDMHYFMDTAQADKQVSIKMDFWLLYLGQDMSTLGATPDATYTKVLTPPSNDFQFGGALTANAVDLRTAGANKEVHSHIAVKLTRLSAGDTHNGGFHLMRSELLVPMSTGEIVMGT